MEPAQVPAGGSYGPRPEIPAGVPGEIGVERRPQHAAGALRVAPAEPTQRAFGDRVDDVWLEFVDELAQVPPPRPGEADGRIAGAADRRNPVGERRVLMRTRIGRRQYLHRMAARFE